MPNLNYLRPLATGKSGGMFRQLPLHTREMIRCPHTHAIGFQITESGPLPVCECWSTIVPLGLTPEALASPCYY